MALTTTRSTRRHVKSGSGGLVLIVEPQAEGNDSSQPREGKLSIGEVPKLSAIT
jgi:hypothetical protein